MIKAERRQSAVPLKKDKGKRITDKTGNPLLAIPFAPPTDYKICSVF
jgi:hypothetical protein